MDYRSISPYELASLVRRPAAAAAAAAFVASFAASAAFDAAHPAAFDETRPNELVSVIRRPAAAAAAAAFEASFAASAAFDAAHPAAFHNAQPVPTNHQVKRLHSQVDTDPILLPLPSLPHSMSSTFLHTPLTQPTVPASLPLTADQDTA